MVERDEKDSKGKNNVVAKQVEVDAAFKKGFEEEKKEEDISTMSDTERARTKEWECCFHGEGKIEDNRARVCLFLAEDDATFFVKDVVQRGFRKEIRGRVNLT